MPEDKTKTDEQTELEKLLNSDESDGEEGSDEEENKGKKSEEENKGDEGEEEEGSEGEENEGEEGQEGEESAGEGEEDEFKGKSREEVIKMLKEQRKKADDLEKGKGKEEDDKGKEKEEGKEDEDQEPTVPSAEELQKMTPSDFAKWVLGRIDEGVKKTIESQEKVKSAVKKEITDAKKEHNLGDPDYRKMVLAIIEAASAKGTVIPLKEACQQVDAFLGKHKGKGEGEDEGESEQLSDEEKSRLKKAKAQVESGAGAPTKPEGSDAEMKRIQKALEGSGQSPLGGLGI